jgi:mannose-1-phosphate guanylyltransferase/phosphomannomutase
MIEATQNKDINFVGDPRGRLIFPQFLFASDAMFSIAKIMEMLACTGLNIMDLERTLPRRIIMQRNVPCPWERKGTVMRKAMEFSDSMERQLIDGVKMFQGSNSVLLLPDKELASFFVIAESDNEEEAHALTTEYAAKVQEWSE